MPQIRFLRAYLVKDDSGTSYEAGQVVECADASAAHFINRQAAELVVDEEPKPKAKPKTTRKTKKAADDGEQDQPEPA